MDILSYTLGKKAGGGSAPVLQDKEVTITENGETEITADSGYDGLSSVNVTTDVAGGGETYDLSSPNLTMIYDSSNVGGASHTTLTTSVKALKDNIVYAIITARDIITLSDNTWTLLKTEKCENAGTIQTSYVYYKKALDNNDISLTVTQNSNARLFISLLSMSNSVKQSENIVSEELLLPSGDKTNLDNINLVNGDILILSIIYANGDSLTDTFTLNCDATKYATGEDEQRMTIFRINEDVKDLIVKHDNSNLSGTFCYIKMTPQTGAKNINEFINMANNVNIGVSFAPSEIYFKNYSGTNLDYYISKLDTSNLTNVTYMFQDCANLISLDLSNFNTQNIESMAGMFQGCLSLTSVDLSNFNTGRLKSMAYMFQNCRSLISLDLSNFNSPVLNGLGSTFEGCIKLEFLDIRNIVFSAIKNPYIYNMFGSSASNGVPNDCEIIVKDDTEKAWINSNFSRLTNVKTVAEYEGN